MDRDSIVKIIELIAPTYNLDTVLIQALIATESSFNVNAMRYEALFTYLTNPPSHAQRLGTSIETEATLQRFSWGLCQLMGSVFRELGFMESLPLALEPHINIQFGCLHFSNYLKKYGAIEDAISSYNQGSPRRGPNGTYFNQIYVDKVLNFYKNLKVVS
jgi:soluble lytic murein transglycosylase-like protein